MLKIRWAVMFIVFTSMLPLTGCGGYVLHGRVVKGYMSHVSITERGGSAIEGEGVSGAHIAVYRDAGRLSQQLIATGISEPDGTFAITLPAFGAGWMEEQWLIQATRGGYQSAESVVSLPVNSRARPALITLSPGRSAPFEQRDDYMRDFERFR